MELLLQHCWQKVGNDGVITVEEAKSLGTTLDVVEGMQFDRGYLSAYMVSDTEKMEAVMENPLILLTDKKISNIQELLPLLEQVVKMGRKLLIVAEDVEGEALTTLVLNKLRGTIDCVAVKAPGFGDRRKAMMEDIAVLTGGVVISEEVGYDLKEATLDMLGQAATVKVDKDSTVIVNGAGEKADITARINSIKKQIEETESEFDKEFKQWIIDFSKKQLPQIYKTIEKYRNSKDIIIFKSRKEADNYLYQFSSELCIYSKVCKNI